TFARERTTTGTDSCDLLASCRGDFREFARGYRLSGALEALWGELLFRGLNDPKIARAHLGAAIRHGHLSPRTLALYGWSALGLSWPGGKQLEAPAASS